MSKGLQRINFLNFAILVKRQYANSVVLGSKHSISLKVGVSDYQCRTFINYGLKNGLIKEINGGYKLTSYDNIIEHLNIGSIKKYSFYKFGTFEQLKDVNLYVIARANFKQQEFNIKQKTKYLTIKKRIETGKYITKAEYRFYNKKCVQSVNKIIVTGQKHISKLLQVSQGMAYRLMLKWVELGFIQRKVSFSKNFDRFDDNRLLRLSIGNYICDGSIIKVLV
jgi:hypothetical protein